MPRNFRLKVFPLPPRLQLKLWNDWQLGKLEWMTGEFDVYHSLDWSLAPTRKPTIATVHDLFFLKSPEIQRHPYHDSLRNRISLAKERSVQAISVSQTTADDLKELVDYPTNLIEVIYEACPGGWGKVSDERKLIELKRRLEIENEYILSVSTQEPRKNLPRLLEAYKKTNRSVQLVIVGKQGWEENLEKGKGIVRTGYLGDDELKLLWSGAKGFVYPSLYEGFGLPILQSFACQVPVLTSNTSSMIEVAGDAAIYVEPAEVDSIVCGLETSIGLDVKNRTLLVNKGKKQLEKFSWGKAARETIKLYEQYA